MEQQQDQDWETLIASRMRPAEHSAELLQREREREREREPKRKAQHRAWAKTEAGKKSMSERGKRYRATEKGKEAARRKSRKYFEEHKNDPIWRAHRLEIQRAWKARKKAERLKENKAA